MQTLRTGEYFGAHYHKHDWGNLILSDTEYTHEYVDWHYHENPYFTYLLAGKLFEANRRDEYYLQPGGLVFHYWQDAHYNRKPREYTRGFHIELKSAWFQHHQVDISQYEGSHRLSDPLLIQTINRLLIESSYADELVKTSVDFLLLDLFGRMATTKENTQHASPSWLQQLEALLNEECRTQFSALALSEELSVHPVHLSRMFHRYFGVTFGKYVRSIRLSRALPLLLNEQLRLTDIAFQCGYYDQSHFTNAFKRTYGKTPHQLRRDLRQRL